MENERLLPAPRRRWWRSRTFVGISVLVALASGLIVFQDSVFMSADLKRMQGKWKLVKINDITDAAVEPEIGKVGSIKGNEFRLHFDPTVPFNIQSTGDRFMLYEPEETERSIFGYKVRVPAWLWRPKSYAYGTIDCAGDKLIIWLKGAVNGGERREDKGEKWYLERQES